MAAAPPPQPTIASPKRPLVPTGGKASKQIASPSLSPSSAQSDEATYRRLRTFAERLGIIAGVDSADAAQADAKLFLMIAHRFIPRQTLVDRLVHLVSHDSTSGSSSILERIGALRLLQLWLDSTPRLCLSKTLAKTLLRVTRSSKTRKAADEHVSSAANHTKLALLRAVARLRSRSMLRKQLSIVMASSRPNANAAKFSVWAFDLKQLSETLTVVQRELLTGVTLASFYKPTSKSTWGAFLTRCIRQSDRTSQWAASMILLQKKPSNHVRMLTKLLFLAHRCLEENNFAGAQAIFAGCSKQCVSRLYSDWNIPRGIRVLYNGLYTAFALQSNFKMYRERLASVQRSSKSPFVPYLAPLLRDAEFADVGNTSSEDGLPSAAKLRVLQDVFTCVHDSQQRHYSRGDGTTSPHALIRYLLEPPAWTEAMQEARSNELKPRRNNSTLGEETAEEMSSPSMMELSSSSNVSGSSDELASTDSSNDLDELDYSSNSTV